MQAFFATAISSKKLVITGATPSIISLAPRYISHGANHHEFKVMVRRLHEAGIEVLLDVVYNHTAEGNHMGPTLSFRGIDNASYYMLAPDKRFYFDTTGCGNTVNLRHPRVLQMVMDSLRYWVEECHVDGFRFDLARSLGREYDEFDTNAVFFDAVRQDPVLSRAKMIAEPWDLGPNGYQVGRFPPGWAEWNGRYRDVMRSYWKGDAGLLPAFARDILASADLFEHQGRKPWASVNFVTAHDGFTLLDLYSYNSKHNEANQEENRDGHDDNRSWNCGVEGPTDDPAILDLRDRMRRNLMATCSWPRHPDAVRALGPAHRRQHNAYCQYNEIAGSSGTSATRSRLHGVTRGLSPSAYHTRCSRTIPARPPTQRERPTSPGSAGRAAMEPPLDDRTPMWSACASSIPARGCAPVNSYHEPIQSSPDAALIIGRSGRYLHGPDKPADWRIGVVRRSG